MTPQLPSNFVGNAAVDVLPNRSMINLLSRSISDLSDTASSIRQAVSSVTDASIRSLITTLDGVENSRNCRKDFQPVLGNDVLVSNWSHLGICALDWGKKLGVIDERSVNLSGIDGVCVVLPRRRDGSMQVMIGLEERCMRRMEVDPDLVDILRKVRM